MTAIEAETFGGLKSRERRAQTEAVTEAAENALPQSDPLGPFYAKAFWAATTICGVALVTGIVAMVRLNVTLTEAVVQLRGVIVVQTDTKLSIDKMLADRYTLTAALADRKVIDDSAAKNAEKIDALAAQIVELKIWKASTEKRP